MIQFEEVKSRKLLSAQIVWFVMWLVVTGIALYLKPSVHNHGTHRQLGLPACPSVVLFDRPCPGCGLTTSFAWSARGNLPAAFKAHALGPVMYGLFTLSALIGIYAAARSLRMRADDRLNWGLAALALVFILYGGVRFALVRLDSESYVGNMRRLAP